MLVFKTESPKERRVKWKSKPGEKDGMKTCHVPETIVALSVVTERLEYQALRIYKSISLVSMMVEKPTRCGESSSAPGVRICSGSIWTGSLRDGRWKIWGRNKAVWSHPSRFSVCLFLLLYQVNHGSLGGLVI